MKARSIVVSIAVAGLLGVAGFGLYQLGVKRGTKLSVPADNPVSHNDASQSTAFSDKKILYWHDPMVPGQKFDKPGKSPFMDMQLVPVYADGVSDEGNVTISPRMQQNLGLRTAEVVEGAIAHTVETVGTVAFNERDLLVVQARNSGFVEKLYVRASLDVVRKGQPLAELYVPDWVSAQEEFLSARRIASTGLESIRDRLVDGARQRMRLVGMTEEQIHLVDSTGTVQARFTVHSPLSGVVVELGAREGMTVVAGAPLFRINGLDTVWINAEVRENQADEVHRGAAVEARTPALPGKVFRGTVGALLADVNPATRTVKARIEIANPVGQLTPGMFATVNFAQPSHKKTLLVPTEAVIQTGTRSIVIVEQGPGQFAPVNVAVGVETDGKSEILRGLFAGQKVVVSGQFLIDSEASLKSSATRMEAPQAEVEGPMHGDSTRMKK